MKNLLVVLSLLFLACVPIEAQVPTSRHINTTGALSGGGDLTADRTIVITTSPTSQSAVVGVDRQIATGSGLFGGGSLNTDLLLGINGGPGIAVGATVSLDQSFSPTWTGTHTFNFNIIMAGMQAQAFTYTDGTKTLVSTSPATDGQILIGRTGNVPIKASLTAGSGISITNGPGSITITNTGGGGGGGGSIGGSTSTNTFVYSNGSNSIGSTSAPTNGQLLIGNTGNPPSVASISSGTGITVTNGAGTISIGTSGPYGVGTFTSNGVLYGNGSATIQVTAQGGANTVLTANAGAPSFSTNPTVTSATATGSVNIGVITNETGQLYLGGNTTTTATIDVAADFDVPVIRLLHTGGTMAARTPLVNGSVLGSLIFSTQNGTFSGDTANLLATIQGSFAADQRPPTGFIFSTNTAGALVRPNFTMSPSGDFSSVGALQTGDNSTFFVTGSVKILGQISGTVSLSVNDTAGTWTMKLPNSGGTSGFVLSTDGTGITSWVSRISGSGTTNTIPKFSGSTTLGNSLITDNGTIVAVTGSILTVGTTPAASGLIRIPNNTSISARNQANGGDVNLVTLNTSNALVLGSSSTSVIPAANNNSSLGSITAAWQYGFYGTRINVGDATNATGDIFAGKSSADSTIVVDAAAGVPILSFRSSNGTQASRTNVVFSNTLGAIYFTGYSAGFSNPTAVIQAVVDGSFTTGQVPPSRLEFYTSLAGAAGTRTALLDSTGNFSTTHQISVGGTGVGQTTGALNLFGHTDGGVTITPLASGNAWTLTLPATTGTNGYVLQTNGSGTTTWVAQNASGDTGNGTANTITKFTGTNTLGNSLITDDGTTVAVTGNILTVGSTLPSAGIIRIPNNTFIETRNITNSGNVVLLGETNTGVTQINAESTVTLKGIDTTILNWDGAGLYMTNIQGGTPTLGASFSYWLTSYIHTGIFDDHLNIGSGTLSTTGLIRVPNDSGFFARNSGNTFDIPLVSINNSDIIQIGLTSTDIVTGASLSLGVNPSATGALRLSNSHSISARNAANTDDIALINLNSSDDIVLGAGFTPVLPDTNNGADFGSSSFIWKNGFFGRVYTTAAVNSTTLAAPGTPQDGDWWVECSGVSPARSCKIKVRDGGSTYTFQDGLAADVVTPTH